MKTILASALAALTVGGAIASVSAPAVAADHGGHGGYHGGGYRGGGYRGGYRGGGWGYGGLAAGVLAGAAIAGAYGAYGPAYGYGYGARYAYAPPCHTEMRWDYRWGGYDRVRVCY